MNKKINGYPFLFVHEPNKVIHLEVVVHSGFIHETKRTSGVNHLLEHVLVSGWKKCKESCNTYWDKHGALVNASTDETAMRYYIKGDKKDIPDMVDYISSIVTRSLFHPSTLEKEKKTTVSKSVFELLHPGRRDWGTQKDRENIWAMGGGYNRRWRLAHATRKAVLWSTSHASLARAEMATCFSACHNLQWRWSNNIA